MKLKPCPFCGSEIDESCYFWEWGYWGVNCSNCFTRGPTCREKEDAGKKWNNQLKIKINKTIKRGIWFVYKNEQPLHQKQYLTYNIFDNHTEILYWNNGFWEKNYTVTHWMHLPPMPESGDI